MFGMDSIWHWLILLVVVLAIFGTKKLINIGPDLGKAMREFKNALSSDDEKSCVATHDEVLHVDSPSAAEKE